MPAAQVAFVGYVPEDGPLLHNFQTPNKKRESKINFAFPGYNRLRSVRGYSGANPPNYKDTTTLVLQRTLRLERAFSPSGQWALSGFLLHALRGNSYARLRGCGFFSLSLGECNFKRKIKRPKSFRLKRNIFI